MAQLDLKKHLEHIGERVERVKQTGIYETQADIDRERLYDMLMASKAWELLMEAI